MKQKILALIFLLSSLSITAQSWSTVSEPEITNTLNGIFMVDENEGWAVGEGGYVIHTTDGFLTFDEQQTNVDKDLEKVFFVNNKYGWIGTTTGSVLRTENGGSTWSDVEFSPADFGFTFFKSLYFVNENLGFATAGKSKNNYLFKTTDGGKTWSVSDSMITTKTMYWTDVKFFDELNGVVIGDKGEMQKYTTDGGANWTPGDSSMMTNFNSLFVQYLSKDEIVCLGAGNEFLSSATPVYKSVDGGKTWVDKTNSSSNVYDRAKCLYFKDSQNGIGLGSDGFSKMFIYKTSDGGETWTASVGDYANGIQDVSGKGDVIYALGSSSHILKSSDLGQTWEMRKIKSIASITDIEFAGSKGIAINTNGDVFVSENGGATWNFITTSGKCYSYDLSLLDENNALILKENLHVTGTADGGDSWGTILEPVKFNSKNKVGGLCFPSSTVGYIWVSLNDYKEYHIYKTLNGGYEWTEVSQLEGSGSISGDIIFFDEDNGFIGGPRIKVDGVYVFWAKVTSDGGLTWTDAVVNAPADVDGSDFKDVEVIDGNSAIALTSAYMYKTIDKGLTWNYIVNDVDTNYYSVDFKGSKGIVASYDGTVLLTENGGETWTRDETYKGNITPNKVALNSSGIPFIGSNRGMIVGQLNTSDVKETNDNIPSDFTLEQNYPNPFNPATTIGFSVKNAGKYSIKIFNVLGQQVADIASHEYVPGNYKITWDASTLASGIYLYKLSGPNVNIIKKMVLMK